MYKYFRTAYSAFYTLAAIFFAGIYFVVSQTSPLASGHLTVILLYVLLFAFIVALTAPIGLSLRRRFAAAPFNVLLKATLRQSVILAVLAIVSLALQAEGLLSWWVAASLLLFFLSVEVFLSI